MSESANFIMVENAAQIYEDHFVPALFKPWAEKIISRSGIQPGDRVLDVACGTGVGARTAQAFAGEGGTIVGLDSTPEMLDEARRRAPEIDWRLGSAETLPFEDASFDMVISLFGLMFFSDKAEGLREMQRVLVPGGRLAVAVWHDLEHVPLYRLFADLLREVGSEEAARWMQTPFSMNDVKELKALAEKAELAGARVETLKGEVRFPSIDAWINCQVGGTPIASILDASQIESILPLARERCLDFVQADGCVVSPIEAHVIQSTRD